MHEIGSLRPCSVDNSFCRGRQRTNKYNARAQLLNCSNILLVILLAWAPFWLTWRCLEDINTLSYAWFTFSSKPKLQFAFFTDPIIQFILGGICIQTMDNQFTEAWYGPKSKQLVLFLCKEPPKTCCIMVSWKQSIGGKLRKISLLKRVQEIGF